MMRLAIAVNNFMSGECLFEAHRMRLNEKTKDVGLAVTMFLIAGQIGYLHEAMLLIRNPNGPELTLETASSLRPYLNALTPESQRDYQTIRHLANDPAERSKFE